MPHDRLLTTTIGAYPKPSCTPIGDWFPDPDDADAGAEGEGLLKRWRRAGYEQKIAEAGEAAEAAFVAAIEEAVRDQVDAGVDVPTDGEVRRENYIFYQCRNMNGIDFEHLTEKVARDGAFTAEVPTITGPVAPRDLVLARDWRIAQRVTDRPVKITLPGPMTVTDSLANAFYPDAKTQGRALAEALNAEVRALAAAGCRHIQVDEPVFARKPEQALDYGIENLERVFHGVPEDVQRSSRTCARLHMESRAAEKYRVRRPLAARLKSTRQVAGRSDCRLRGFDLRQDAALAEFVDEGPASSCAGPRCTTPPPWRSKVAYKRLAQRFHPDRARPEDEEAATWCMQEINRIWDALPEN